MSSTTIFGIAGGVGAGVGGLVFAVANLAKKRTKTNSQVANPQHLI